MHNLGGGGFISFVPFKDQQNPGDEGRALSETCSDRARRCATPLEIGFSTLEKAIHPSIHPSTSSIGCCFGHDSSTLLSKVQGGCGTGARRGAPKMSIKDRTGASIQSGDRTKTQQRMSSLLPRTVAILLPCRNRAGPPLGHGHGHEVICALLELQRRDRPRTAQWRQARRRRLRTRPVHGHAGRGQRDICNEAAAHG